MKILHKILIVGLLIGCNSNNQQSLDGDTKQVFEDSINLEIIGSKNLNSIDTLICRCGEKDYKRSFSTQVIFQKHFSVDNDSLFDFWSNDTLKNKLKSIRFVGYDTIPDKYKTFTEIEKLSINTRNGIYGLDYFPKLEIVYFFGSVIDIKPNEKWTQRVEAIFAAKTKFTGLESFKRFRNLKVIEMGYSGFDSFPYDIEAMKCLEKLVLGAYMFGNINLDSVDLMNNVCLKEVEFQTWYNSLSGIPRGLDNSSLESVKIHHQKLSDTEKEILQNANWQQ